MTNYVDLHQVCMSAAQAQSSEEFDDQQSPLLMTGLSDIFIFTVYKWQLQSANSLK